MPGPSEHALAQVGKEISWERFSPRPRKAQGICIGVERIPGMTVSNDNGTFPAVRFQIRDKATGKLVWTDAFADEPPAKPRGTCTVCGRDYALTVHGTLRAHNRHLRGVGSGVCRGSSKAPA